MPDPDNPFEEQEGRVKIRPQTADILRQQAGVVPSEPGEEPVQINRRPLMNRIHKNLPSLTEDQVAALADLVAADWQQNPPDDGDDDAAQARRNESIMEIARRHGFAPQRDAATPAPSDGQPVGEVPEGAAGDSLEKRLADANAKAVGDPLEQLVETIHEVFQGVLKQLSEVVSRTDALEARTLAVEEDREALRRELDEVRAHNAALQAQVAGLEQDHINPEEFGKLLGEAVGSRMASLLAQYFPKGNT